MKHLVVSDELAEEIREKAGKNDDERLKRWRKDKIAEGFTEEDIRLIAGDVAEEKIEEAKTQY